MFKIQNSKLEVEICLKNLIIRILDLFGIGPKRTLRPIFGFRICVSWVRDW